MWKSLRLAVRSLPCSLSTHVCALPYLPGAGEGLLLLITGGDDQALGLTLLQLDVQPASAGSQEGSRDGDHSSSSNGSGGRVGSARCIELLRLTIPNAHSSALRSVWVSPLLSVPSSCSGSQAGPRGGNSSSSSRLGASAGAAAGQRAVAAAASAAREAAGVAGDDPALQATVFTLGLDQQVRRWRLQLLPCQRAPSAAKPAVVGGTGGSTGGSTGSSSFPELALGALDELDEAVAAGEPWFKAARYSASSAPGSSPSGSGSSGGSSPGWRISAEEAGCRFTQVAEPAALDVLPCGGGEAAALPGPSGGYVIVVAGRGVELLTWG